MLTKRLLYFVLITLCLPLMLLYGEQGFDIINNKATLQILTPSLASQEKLKIKLKNGLEVMLISDPDADASGASLTVGTGSWEDPKDHAGIAHFLEHMLFLGTTKFPIESDYDRFISENGGVSNAFTGNYYTGYIFEVNNNAFEEALDRFSSFFKEPLFNPSGVSRELKAIDQEYAKNVENDSIREMFVIKESADPSHPYHDFNMGNSKTLSKVTREELKEWYYKHYSANIMKLVLYSNLPLENLKKLAVTYFSGITNIDRPPLKMSTTPKMTKNEGKITYITPIMEDRKVTLYWTLPARFAEMKEYKPEALVGYILGHEGSGSLLAKLKEEKLAEALGCGGIKIGPGAMQFFIEVTLTKEGLKNVDHVILRCFQAIALLKEEGVPAYIFNDLKQMQTLKYQYATPQRTFSTLMGYAGSIMDEEMESYPEKTNIIQLYNPDAIQDFINELTAQNVRINIMAMPEETGVKSDQTERWLGVEYAFKPIAEDSVDRWASVEILEDIVLPLPNPYLASDLQLVRPGVPYSKTDKKMPYPTPVIDNEYGKIYFAEDSTYLIPKIYWNIIVRTPAVDESDPKKTVLADLYIKCVEEALNDESYPASLAELDFNLERKPNGIGIKIQGYSEKAHLLFDEILIRMKKIQLNNKKFQIYKESLLRNYLNAAKDSPLVQAVELFKSAIYKDFSTSRQKANAIKKITKHDFVQYAPTLYKNVYFEGMLYGNMTHAQASSLAGKLRNTFKGEPYAKADRKDQRVAILPDTGGPYLLEGKTKSQGNSAILAIQSTPFSQKARGAQQIVMQGIRDGFFATLRTKQQTGYIVQSSAEEIQKELFDVFMVQSNSHDARDLLHRFELFLEGYLQELTTVEIPEVRFERIKSSIISQLEQKPVNLFTMGDMLMKFAFEYNGAFDWKDQRIRGLNELTYSEFITLSKDFLGKNNKRRFAILLDGVIPEDKVFRYQKVNSLVKMKELNSYINGTGESDDILEDPESESYSYFSTQKDANASSEKGK